MRSKEAVKSPLRNLIGGPWLVIGMLLLSGVGLVLAVLRRRKLRENPPETVAEVDLAKYAGLWYEIARLPSSFQQDCAGSTAFYELRDNGTLSVRNHCYVGTLDGPEREISGSAWISDPEQPARLKVRLGWMPFTSDYWILQLGPKYRYAVVGTPDRRHLWILSREPEMDMHLYQDIIARVELAGFNTERLVDTLQPLESDFESDEDVTDED
ncbi:lipocalin family protein [bacterium]|nr:lipocalin family protein [bacterium]